MCRRHLKINKHGIFNAMIYWYELALGSDDIVLSTKPGSSINWQQGIQEYDFDIPLREGSIMANLLTNFIKMLSCQSKREPISKMLFSQLI